MLSRDSSRHDSQTPTFGRKSHRSHHNSGNNLAIDSSENTLLEMTPSSPGLMEKVAVARISAAR